VQDVIGTGKSTYLRREKPRKIGLFVDGVNLDRASRRVGKKVDWKLLAKLVSEGRALNLLRYYTVIPNEDDARHHSFLGVIEGAGYEVVLKRLPPKGVNKTVTTDLELTADILKFSFQEKINALTLHSELENTSTIEIVLVCPPDDIEYALRILLDQGIKITIVDFKSHNAPSLVKLSSKWMDLSDVNIYR
jgi:hypothetical protein